jgi:hypothetical protein
MRPLASPAAFRCRYLAREVEPMRVVKIDHGTEQIPAPVDGLAELQLEHPLVVVIWRDAFFDFDQASAEDVRPDYLVHTVGFLLADGPTFVSLAQEVLPDGDGYRAVTHIPTSLVHRLVRLQAHGLASTDD